jgi:hypothetical protein
MPNQPQNKRAHRHIASGTPLPAGSPRRGKIALGHISGHAPLSVRQPTFLEWLEPAGYIDAHCLDCTSEVTMMLGAPACVEAAFTVRHSDGCPAFATMAGEQR